MPTSAAQRRYDWFVERVLDGTLDDDAVAQGFAPSFVEKLSAARVIEMGRNLGALLRAPVVDTTETGSTIVVEYASMAATADVEPSPPHRFVRLHFGPLRVDDPRLTHAPWSVEGDADPDFDKTKSFFEENSLVGIVVAGFEGGEPTPTRRIAGGYRDIAAHERTTMDDVMFAGSITKLLTAVAALRLVGGGHLTLDARANDHLTNLRVASDDVTVLHLLTHTSGVSSDFEHFADEVPPPESLLGREVRVDSTPGAGWTYSNGGYTVLGEIIATVTGSTVDRAITDLVLTPLAMSSSAFARSWPDTIGPGYTVEDHRLVEVPRKVASVLAPGGLITTAGDLGRFVMGWQGLLPRQLAAAAIQPATPVTDGQGLGWALGRVRGERTAGHPGGVLGFSSSLLWLPDHGVARIVLTNRAVQPQALTESLIRSELRRA